MSLIESSIKGLSLWIFMNGDCHAEFYDLINFPVTFSKSTWNTLPMTDEKNQNGENTSFYSACVTKLICRLVPKKKGFLLKTCCSK